jgi:hypothetical protein
MISTIGRAAAAAYPKWVVINLKIDPTSAETPTIQASPELHDDCGRSAGQIAEIELDDRGPTGGNQL